MAAVTDAACSNYDMTHRTETINRNAFSPQSIASPRFWSYLGGVTFLSFFAAFVLFDPSVRYMRRSTRIPWPIGTRQRLSPPNTGKCSNAWRRAGILGT
jgi:hypothetical protein